MGRGRGTCGRCRTGRLRAGQGCNGHQGGSRAGAPLPAQTVKIAFIDPLSGPFAGVGTNLLRHFQFMAEIVNAQQLAGPGIKFEIVPFDNKASPQESLTVLKQVIDQGIRFVAQGNGSGAALALIDAHREAQRAQSRLRPSSSSTTRRSTRT